MSWMITYAVSSTMIALLVIATEKRFRPEWREALLWLAVFAPLLIASATFIARAPANVSAFATVAPTISIIAPDIHVTPRATLDIGFIAVVIWIAVALVILARDLILHRRLIAAIDRRPATHCGLAAVASQLRIRRPIKLTRSESLPVPIAIGSREICLPASLLESAARDELEPIFAHELAHLRRRDPQIQQAARIFAVVLWWQPFNRVIARKLAAVAELRADALCSSVVEPTRIARTLLLFAQ
ncbi:MAG: M56 family metallopeptidase, partial [Gemmatimonadales bacterium]